ncbi:porin [Xanthobacter variabilis]|uniref:porin n=1 Tax=Xanthobacter variabilis TaxID=3119932 RepID=UPI00372C6C79
MLSSASPASSIAAGQLGKRTAAWRTGTFAAGRPCLFTTAYAVAITATLIAASGAAYAQKAPTKSADCAALGEGFMKMPGSDTCVRMQGAVRMDAGSGRSVSNTGSFGNSATELGSSSSNSSQGSTSDPWKQAR